MKVKFIQHHQNYCRGSEYPISEIKNAEWLEKNGIVKICPDVVESIIQAPEVKKKGKK
jgi:hypothetical protein